LITGMPRIAIATPDFDGLVHTCRHALGLPVIDLRAEFQPTLGAQLAMCVPEGGSHLELMSPGDPAAPLSQSLQRFLDRRGQGLFALMLEAPDPDAEAETLAQRGLNVLPRMAHAGGRDIHPNATHGVLIRVYPVDSFTGRPPPGTPTGPLSGVVRVRIAVRDLDRAIRTYGLGLGLAVDAPVLDAQRGVASALVHPPSGGAIELLAVRDATRPLAAAIDAHLASQGEGLYALTLQARQPTALLPGMHSRGLQARAAADDPETIEIPPAAMFGARIRIEPSPG
jgi:catechol 2,3-dioxygenase-like lactoylglutathione lyase family enzyme